MTGARKDRVNWREVPHWVLTALALFFLVTCIVGLA